MEIRINDLGVNIQGLSISELRVISSALGTLVNEAGSEQAYASEVAENLAARIPAVIFKVPKYLCTQCRTNFYQDELVLLEIGSRAEKVEVCPRCESHLIERVTSRG